MSPDLLVLLSAFLSGLMGSAHCAAMCGGIATGLTVQRPGSSWLDALEPNIGRVIGYSLAGALAGGMGHGIVGIAQLPGLAQALRAAVGLVLIVSALRLLDRRGRLAFLALPAVTGWRWLRPLQRKFMPADSGTKRVLAGVVWAWLPCGLSTTVLLAAGLQASAPSGAMTMLAFGLGTLPTMVPLTWSGARLGQRLQRSRWRAPVGAVVLIAGMLTVMGPWLAQLPTLHRALSALGCRSLS
jgi:sulfite exporter TauE/SafE